jgi:hypothetical protein
MAWQVFAANAPRFIGTPPRLLIEGQRTNLLANPRGVGIIGVGPPTGWTFAGTQGGVGRQYAASTMEGLPSTIITLNAATTGAMNQRVSLSAAAAVAPNQTYAVSAIVRLVAGSLANLNGLFFAIDWFDSGAALIGSTISMVSLLATLTGTPQRVVGSAVAPANAATALVSLRFSAATSGLAINVGVEVAGQMLELGAFRSTPILPGPGLTGASTRGADLISATLGSLGIGASGACTILGVATLPQNAPSGADQMIVQIDGGDTNRYRLRNVAGGASMMAGSVNGGSPTDAPGLGSMTPGSPFRFGLAMSGAGRIAAGINAGAIQAANGGPTNGLSALRVGNNASNTAPGFLFLHRLDVLPQVLSDTALAQRIANLPLT